MRWSLVPVLLLYTGHEMSRATALMWCVRSQNALSFVEAFLIRLSGEAVECLTFTGPMLSEPMKAWLLQRTGLELSEGLSATLTEYLASMVTGAVTAVIGVSYVLLALHPVGPVRVSRDRHSLVDVGVPGFHDHCGGHTHSHGQHAGER